MTGSMALQKLITVSSDSISRIRQLIEPVRRILFFSLADEALVPKRALAVSIETGHLSIVYGSRSFSRIRVRRARIIPFEEGKYPTPANVASALAMARNELKAFRSEITLSIPKVWAVARSTELPITVKQNLAEVISYELDRLTPFASGSALYDFRVLDEADGKLRVMLIAAKSDVIDPYIKAIREKGVKVDRVTVSPSAMGTFCTYRHPQQSTIFASIGEGGYEVGLVLDNLLASFCAGSVNAGSESSTLDAVVEEINRCAVEATRHGGTPRLLLCTREGDLSEQLRERVPSAVDLLDGAEASLKLPRMVTGVPAAAAGSMLESLWPQARGFNLLEKGRREKRATPLVFSLVLLALLLALGVLYVFAPLRLEEKRLEEIERRVASIRPDVKKTEALKKEVDVLEAEAATIDNFKKGRPMTLVILKELTAILPKTAWLTRARITDTTVEIEGYAAAATELLSKLEASPYLKKVEFASPTFRDVRLNSDRFVIKMEIEIPGKEGEEKSKQ